MSNFTSSLPPALRTMKKFEDQGEACSEPMAPPRDGDSLQCSASIFIWSFMLAQALRSRILSIMDRILTKALGQELNQKNLPVTVDSKPVRRLLLIAAISCVVCSHGAAQQSQSDSVPDSPSPIHRCKPAPNPQMHSRTVRRWS